MYKKRDIIENLQQLGVLRTDNVMVHTSLKSIGTLENGGDTVLDAFCEYLSDGLLVLPGHTWSYINSENPLFDAEESPVCVGVMPELFRKRSGVYRSLHPTHSLLAFGKGAEQFVMGQEKIDTPCSPDSCYGRLEVMNGKLMLIGVDFSRCTLVHCIEEVAKVPGRLTDWYQNLIVKDKNGVIYNVPSRRHQNANSDYYEKLEPVLDYKGVLTRGKVGNADTIVCGVKDLFSIVLDLLEKDIKLFDNNQPIPEDWYKNIH